MAIVRDLRNCQTVKNVQKNLQPATNKQIFDLGIVRLRRTKRGARFKSLGKDMLTTAIKNYKKVKNNIVSKCNKIVNLLVDPH